MSPPAAAAVAPRAPRRTLMRRPLWQTLTLAALWAFVGACLFWASAGRPNGPVVAATATPETTPTPDAATTSEGSPVLNVAEGGRYREDLKDPLGKIVGEVIMLLLADEDVWVVGSETEIMNVGDILKKGAGAFSAPLLEDLRGASELVVFGAADFVGVRQREEGRADARGRNMKKVLTNDVKQKGGTVHYVELGQWDPSRDPRCQQVPRAAQRRIVIGRVIRFDEDADLAPSLRDALVRSQNKHEVFKDILTCYSGSDGFRLR